MNKFSSIAAIVAATYFCPVGSVPVTAQENQAEPVETAATASKIAEAALGETRNVHTFGDSMLCGQPSEEEFGVARDRGIRTIITLREPNEIDWDEPEVVRSLGLKFHAFGFRSPESLTFELLDRVLAVMADGESQPVMLHCASANRVGAVWMAHRVLHDKIDLSQARDEAKEVGLRTPAYEAKVLDYIRERQSKRPTPSP